LIDALSTTGCSRFAPAEGAFYLYVDISHLTRDSEDFCRLLLAETGVAVTPGRDFDPIDGGGWVRFSFAGSTKDVAEAARRLQAFASNPSWHGGLQTRRGPKSLPSG
jgi:aspartate/methionine/tyrosine aminotransferase